MKPSILLLAGWMPNGTPTCRIMGDGTKERTLADALKQTGYFGWEAEDGAA
jgi:hypothetical protein